MKNRPRLTLAARPRSDWSADGVCRTRIARRVRAACALGSAALVCGCYELRPTMDIQPRTDVQFRVELSDQARVAVVGQLGPEVREVTGHVLSRTEDDVVISAEEVVYLRGEILKMHGDTVHLNRQQLTSVTERKFSLSKTMIVAAGVAVALGVFLGSKSLFGAGGSSKDGNGNGNGEAAFRHP